MKQANSNAIKPTTGDQKTKKRVVIRFCGDSGDGMQLTGSRFTETAAIMGNDIATFPDFPAEIRAPAGSLAGVSGYQLQFSAEDIHTPGDQPDVLVAMNPAALKTNLDDLRENGILIVNSDTFNEANLKYAQYTSNPLEDDSLDGYRLYKLPITTLTSEALKESPLTKKEVERCKNFFALGLMYWLYDRKLEITLEWIANKFQKKPELVKANQQALKSGYFYGETAEVFTKTYTVPKAKLKAGHYRHITGNQATALGFVSAAWLANKSLTYASYPITPASDILHELSKHKDFGVKTLQAEDEIAAIGMALGASFAGDIALTGTSGPGLSLKGEVLGLAIMMELPMVVINVQRGGPSTGLPTKTEQADLLQAIFGRHAESPLPVIAPATPGECFDYAIEAVRIATESMTPVIFLSDAYLANGAEPWPIPQVDQLKPITIEHPKYVENKVFEPYVRQPETLSRPWALPGTPGLEHRLGGLEKAQGSGNVSYDPDNHEAMVRLRAEKIAKIADRLPKTTVYGPEKGDILLVGWGGTFGSLLSSSQELNDQGFAASVVHLRYLNPLPKDLESIFGQFKKIFVCELNLGQLFLILKSKFDFDFELISKVKGKPFKVEEITSKVKQSL